MEIVLITYADDKFEAAKNRFVNQAQDSGVFTKVIAYNPDLVPDEVKRMPTWQIKRGGGLWTWKPAVILQTINELKDGDIVVYADAGCSVYNTAEWRAIEKILSKYDIIAQRLYQRTDKWTRREVLEYFINTNGKYWPKLFQYEATVLLRVSDFSKKFVQEWLDFIISHPGFVMDVKDEEKHKQHPTFIENRHDQTIYSALIYKYSVKTQSKCHIHTQWEHVEEYDPFFKQAIRATRLRDGMDETSRKKRVRLIRRLIKDYIMKPFYYAPAQLWYNYLNKRWIQKNLKYNLK